MGPIAGIRLPGTSTPAKKPQAQANYQRKNHTAFSIYSVEFGEDHWLEDLSSLSSTARTFSRACEYSLRDDRDVRARG
jgi:hypothetical protein